MRYQLTYRDLVDYMSLSTQRMIDLPARPTVSGAPVSPGGLTPAESAALAHLDAATTLLGRLGMLRDNVELEAAQVGPDGSIWEG